MKIQRSVALFFRNGGVIFLTEVALFYSRTAVAPLQYFNATREYFNATCGGKNNAKTTGKKNTKVALLRFQMRG